MELSQEQINSLLSGSPGTGALLPNEIETLTEIGKISMNNGAIAISSALGQDVTIGSPKVNVVKFEDLMNFSSSPVVIISFRYEIGQSFENVLLIKDDVTAIIFDLLMGKDGRNPDPNISDLQISALNEIINQALGTASTAIADNYKKKVKMSPPNASFSNVNDEKAFPLGYVSNELVKLSYSFVISDLVNSEIVQLMTIKVAQGLIKTLTVSEAAPPPPLPQQPQPAYEAQYAQQPQQYQAYPPPPQQAYAGPPPPIRPAQFSPLVAQGDFPPPGSLDMVMDIPLRLTVELGSSKMKIKEVLDLGRGSVVELNRLAGEPVDLLINGKLVAKGEVVVINENFGLRITEIVGQVERLDGLGKR